MAVSPLSGPRAHQLFAHAATMAGPAVDPTEKAPRMPEVNGPHCVLPRPGLPGPEAWVGRVPEAVVQAFLQPGQRFGSDGVRH